MDNTWCNFTCNSIFGGSSTKARDRTAKSRAIKRHDKYWKRMLRDCKINKRSAKTVVFLKYFCCSLQKSDFSAIFGIISPNMSCLLRKFYKSCWQEPNGTRSQMPDTMISRTFLQFSSFFCLQVTLKAQ